LALFGVKSVIFSDLKNGEYNIFRCHHCSQFTLFIFFTFLMFLVHFLPWTLLFFPLFPFILNIFVYKLFNKNQFSRVNNLLELFLSWYYFFECTNLTSVCHKTFILINYELCNSWYFFETDTILISKSL
jgi:hypothetical protein